MDVATYYNTHKLFNKMHINRKLYLKVKMYVLV